MLFLSTCLEIITIVYDLFKLEDSAIASSAREKVLGLTLRFFLRQRRNRFAAAL